MQIASIISSTQVAQASRETAPATVATTAQKVAETVNLETADQATQIMKKYDLHSMDYHEIGKMSKELHDAGIITGLQKVMMTAPLLGATSNWLMAKRLLTIVTQRLYFLQK